MSANNYLKISRDNDEFVITEMWAEDCDNPVITELHRENDCVKACEWAEDYQREHYVEYGIRFI